MNIWFYVSVILFTICVVLLLKIIIMKLSIKDISKNIVKRLESDTNNLLTISSNDMDIKNLVKILNRSLKLLRNLELEYKQGNIDLKHSITNISHDLRTPLTAIRGYLDIIEITDLKKKQRDYISVIDMKVDDLIYLTEQLFLYSKGFVDLERVNRTSVCLNLELENIICSFYTLFKEKGIEPNIHFCNNKVIKELDLNCFKRIMENIISNAIKYSEGELKITLSETGEIVFINRTTKLDKTSVEKLFDRYFTVEDGKQGTGLGLSIAKSLTELNGGIMKAIYAKNYLKIIIKF